MKPQPMTRRERREGQREVLKLLRQINDGSEPLVYSQAGEGFTYMHLDCQGQGVERANNVGAGDYCPVCQKTVPRERVRLVRAK